MRPATNIGGISTKFADRESTKSQRKRWRERRAKPGPRSSNPKDPRKGLHYSAQRKIAPILRLPRADKRDSQKKNSSERTSHFALPFKKPGEESRNAIHTMQSKPCSPQDTICTAQSAGSNCTTAAILDARTMRVIHVAWYGIQSVIAVKREGRKEKKSIPISDRLETASKVVTSLACEVSQTE